MSPRPCAVALLLFGGFGCGPSVQSIHEGDVRFEHCYRLDLELETAATHRQACWRTWLAQYTYGQPRDRIEYARRRVKAFASGDTSRPVLDVGAEKRPEERQFYLVVPGPTSVHAPPPPIATVSNAPSAAPPPDASADTAAKTAPSAISSVTPPGAPCTTACADQYGECEKTCVPGGNPIASCRQCEPDYKRCMKRCLD